MIDVRSLAKTINFLRRNYLPLAALIGLITLALVLISLVENTSEPSALQGQWVPVRPQILETQLGLIGRIQPVLQETIATPFDGIIREVLAHEGQQVVSGQLLMRLDPTQIDILVRQALAEVLKAQRYVQQLQDWESSPDVLRARRSMQAANSTLDNTQISLRDTQALFERGIVPRMEVDALVQQAQTQQQNLLAAQQEMRIVEARGNGEDRRIAEMELVNARARHSALIAQREMQELKASFAGVVVRPLAVDGGKNFVLQSGLQVTRGTPLMVVTGLDRLQVLTQVEETDLHQLNVGIPVQITGDGFPGRTLLGHVASIGMQSNATDGQGARYDVVVAMDTLPAGTSSSLRLGMSARLHVILHRNEHGIAVPAEALKYDETGDVSLLWRPDPGKAAQKITVTRGKPVAQGVEVSGVGAGEVLVPLSADGH